MRIISKLKSISANKSIRNGTLFSLFSFINRGFSFFLLLVLANYILPTDYGYLSLFGTVVMLLGYFFAMSTEGYMTVAYFKDGKDGVKNAFSCVFYTSLISLAIFTLLLLAGGDSLERVLKLPLKILYLSVFIGFFTLYTHVNLDLFRIQEKVKLYGFFSCLNAFLNFVVSIVLVKYLLLGWEGRVYAQLACFSLFGLACFLFFIRDGLLGKPNWPCWKSMLLWGIPLIPHLSINFIRQGMDRYIVDYNHGVESVGLFSFALNLANIIFMIGMGFNQSNSVDIYKVLGNKDLENKFKIDLLKKQRYMLLGVYLVATILVSAACFVGVPLFLPKYVGSLAYFPVLAVYAFFYCCYLLYTNYLFFFKKTKNIMYVTFSASLLHLALSLLLTRYSLMFTCFVYCFSQLLIVVGIRYLALKTLRLELKESV